MGPQHADVTVLSRAALLAANGERQAAVDLLGAHDFEPAREIVAAALRGAILEEMDEHAAAGAAYREALEKHPDDALLHLRLGVLSYRAGDLRKAESHFLRSWQLQPLAEAAYHLGELYALSGRPARARTFLVEAAARESAGSPWRAKAIQQLEELAEDRERDPQGSEPAEGPDP